MERLSTLSQRFRIELLDLYNKVNWGDLPSMFSCLDILIALYYGQIDQEPILKHRPLEPSWEDRDFFVLSKTQALLAQYFILSKRGYFDENELEKTHYHNPHLPYLPHIKTPGINAATRIPGTGLAITTGFALQKKQQNKNNHIFCLCGDSEIQQGLFWESLMLIQHYQLKNITIIIDYNELQMCTPIRSSINFHPLGEKLSRFGFRVIPIAQGHDFPELLNTMHKAKNSLRPTVLITHTIKGKGISFLERRTSYSYQPLSSHELTIASNELK